MQPRRTSKIIFGFILKLAALLLLNASFHQATGAGGDLTITGKVSDAAGKPIADAIVMVYHAGPTSGYSLFCPSCYADCGKRAITDANGAFTFHRLSPGLWFELFVAKSGYEPKFVEKVVPAPDAPVTSTLDARSKGSDPKQAFRGRIVDSSGLAQRDAVVQLVGALWDAKNTTVIGAIPGVDPIAVTDHDGVFEIDSFSAKQVLMPSASGPPVKILISVEARGMAGAFSVIPAGLERHVITVSEGAVVRGPTAPSRLPECRFQETGTCTPKWNRWLRAAQPEMWRARRNRMAKSLTSVISKSKPRTISGAKLC